MAAVFSITALVIISVLQLIFMAEAKDCTNPPPGIQKMFTGVDITTMDLLQIEFGDNGFTKPVVKLTCDKGKTWKSSNGKVYQLPDQISKVTSLPGDWTSAVAKVYMLSNEIREAFGFDVGLYDKQYAFSSSVSYTSMQKTIINTPKYIADVGAYIFANTVEMEPVNVLSLDDHAKAAFEKDLTGTYETNPKAYNDFIRTYGTHFFYRANFGGFIRAIYKTDTKYFLSNSEETVKVNAKASYMSLISVLSGVSTNTGNIDETFTQSSSQSTRFYGGNTDIFYGWGRGLESWKATIADDPWLFSGKLNPVSSLFTDSTKRKSMESAVEQYVLRSYVGELERLLQYAPTNSYDAGLNSLQMKIKNLNDKKVLARSDVSGLGDIIEYQIRYSQLK